MRHGSLFSGIGGFDLAAEWMGWENVFHCEWMEFPRKVLDYHFPNSDSHIDICKTDFKKYANKIDILTGGFPCQPFSLAGKRKGTDDERYLWHEMLRAIQEIKPKFVIAENVFGITNIDGGLVFEQVCLDLEAQGYEVQPFVLPAAAKNAPHRRDRVWFVAYSNVLRSTSNIQWKKGQHSKSGRETQCEFNGNGSEETTSDTKRGGRLQILKDIQPKKSNGKRIVGNGREWDVTNPHSVGQELSKKRHGSQNIKSFKPFKQLHKFQPKGWEKFPTQSPICGGDDGLPSELDGITIPKWRAESIKGYGNAIVPQVALELFKVIERLNNEL